MPRIDRRAGDQPPAHHRRGDLDDERERPEPVARGRREEQRGEPDDHGCGEGAEVEDGDPPTFLHVADRARIEDEQHNTDEDVREDEPPRGAGEGVGQGRREGGHAEHRREDQEPVGHVVRVEAVRVEGEAHPRPPDGDGEREEAQEAVRGDVVAQLLPELRDGDDEHQVEEELEPRGVAGLVLAEGPEPRRFAEASDPLHRTSAARPWRAQRLSAKTSPSRNARPIMRLTSTAGRHVTCPSLIT